MINLNKYFILSCIYVVMIIEILFVSNNSVYGNDTSSEEIRLYKNSRLALYARPRKAADPNDMSNTVEYIQGMPIILSTRIANLQYRNNNKEAQPIDIPSTWKKLMNFSFISENNNHLDIKVLPNAREPEEKQTGSLSIAKKQLHHYWVISGKETLKLAEGTYRILVSFADIQAKHITIRIIKKTTKDSNKIQVGAAWEALELGNFEEAIKNAEQAMNKGGRLIWADNMHAIRVAAHAYEELHNYQKALDLWEEYKSLIPPPKPGEERGLLEGKIQTLKNSLQESNSNPQIAPIAQTNTGSNTILIIFTTVCFCAVITAGVLFLFFKKKSPTPPA